MAHPGGFEPPTSRLTVERSNQTELWVNKHFKDIFRSSTQTELWVNVKLLKTFSGLLPPGGLEPPTPRLEV